MCLFGIESCGDAIQTINVFANIMTIIGVILAIYIATRWKAQQNYSFIRDKIFELELAASELYNQEIYYLLVFKDNAMKRRDGTHNAEYFLAETKHRLTKLQECLKEYDIKLRGLEVLEVKYDKKLLGSASTVDHFFDKIVEKINATSDPNKVIYDFEGIYLIRANDAKKLALEHLKSLRKRV